MLVIRVAPLLRSAARRAFESASRGGTPLRARPLLLPPSGDCREFDEAFLEGAVRELGRLGIGLRIAGEHRLTLRQVPRWLRRVDSELVLQRIFEILGEVSRGPDSAGFLEVAAEGLAELAALPGSDREWLRSDVLEALEDELRSGGEVDAEWGRVLEPAWLGGLFAAEGMPGASSGESDA